MKFQLTSPPPFQRVRFRHTRITNLLEHTGGTKGFSAEAELEKTSLLEIQNVSIGRKCEDN